MMKHGHDDREIEREMRERDGNGTTRKISSYTQMETIYTWFHHIYLWREREREEEREMEMEVQGNFPAILKWRLIIKTIIAA